MTENTDPIEAALAAFTSASWALECAAQRYFEAVIASEREGFREFCREQDADADLYDLVHEYVDNLETVVYTHRARALVIGFGEDDARYHYGHEIGWSDREEPISWKALAYWILTGKLDEIAHEIEGEAERKEQEAAR